MSIGDYRVSWSEKSLWKTFEGAKERKRTKKKETQRPDGNDASEEIRQKARIPSEAWKSFAKNAQLSHIPTGPTAIDTRELNFSEILFAELDAHNSVLPVAGPNSRAAEWGFRPLSNTHWPSHDARRWSVRSDAAAIQAAPMQQLTLSFLCSRHCSCRRSLFRLPVGVNVPGLSMFVGRFSGDHHWPVLGDRRGPILHLIKLVPSGCVELMWHLSYPQC